MIISEVQKGVILSSCVFIIGMSMCIVGGKRFVSRSVNSSLTGSLERKCSSLSGEEFEVKQQKWYNQGFWMPKGTGCLNEGEALYDNSSRIEPKRSHQWFMDGPEVELFPNKKQAVEVPNNNLFSGMLNANVSPWGNVPSFHSFSGHFTERLFDSETDRAVNFDDRNIPAAETEKMNLARKVNEDLFGNDSSFGLSMSHTLEDPRTSPNYGDNGAMLAAHVYKADDNTASMGLAYKKGDDSFISMSDNYNRADNNFISMGQPFNKGDENISIGQTYKESNNTLSMGQTFNKGDNNIISIGQTYNKVEESTISAGHIYNKGEDSTISTGHAYSKGDSNMLSIGHSYNNRESTIISFGGYDDDDAHTSAISGYELLMGQPFPKTEAMNEKELGKSNADALVNLPHITAGNENISKKKVEQKMSKKVPPNNFPSNVRSLLSTGMLDGVPVKYTAWSREKELQGVIKGSGYLCGCQSCDFSKTITGSPINQKSFRLWKATRELQRIYGKDEGKQFHEASLLELQGRIIFVLCIQVIFFGYNSVLVDGGFTTNTRARARGTVDDERNEESKNL
ncbi:hypothetical protein Prudu_017636 [Prunus dulcis]|uniref:Uncharacterized protein n=1 Tax=Prunus dulcis TaxID=3755 RepID=A0A4Y1RP09_PRUDU|nr:hypothetical protein Prudu_017636 [Prunus dulcis]